MSRLNRAALLCVGAALSLMYLSTITRAEPAKPLGNIVIQGCVPAAEYEKELDLHHKKPVYSHGVEAAAFISAFNALPPMSDHSADVLRFDVYFHMARVLVGIVGMDERCVLFHNAVPMDVFLHLYDTAKKKARGGVL